MIVSRLYIDIKVVLILMTIISTIIGYYCLSNIGLKNIILWKIVR